MIRSFDPKVTSNYRGSVLQWRPTPCWWDLSLQYQLLAQVRDKYYTSPITILVVWASLYFVQLHQSVPVNQTCPTSKLGEYSRGLEHDEDKPGVRPCVLSPCAANVMPQKNEGGLQCKLCILHILSPWSIMSGTLHYALEGGRYLRREKDPH